MAAKGLDHVLAAIARGALASCPRCGKGRLFRAYLKPVEACDHCLEPFWHIRADDGPAWLTILIVGHVVVGLALWVEMHAPLPVWVALLVFSGGALAMALSLLPRAKGIFIAAIWAMKAPGSEKP